MPHERIGGYQTPLQPPGCSICVKTFRDICCFRLTNYIFAQQVQHNLLNAITNDWLDALSRAGEHCARNVVPTTTRPKAPVRS